MKTGKSWGAAALYILLGGTAVGLAGIGMVMLLQRIAGTQAIFRPEIVLTILLVISVLVFLIVLSVVAAILAALPLADPTRALGMPEGTVRAVIALSLLLIFVTVSMFLFNQLETTSYVSTGLPKTQFETLFEKHPERFAFFEKKGEFYNVRLRTEAGDTARHFAIEMLSILGTLVGTVSGFYFGIRAVATARGMVVSPEPSIKDIEPKVGEAEKEVPVKISGKNFDGPVEVNLVKGSKKILEIKDPPCSSKEIACTFNLKGIAPGVYDLVVVNQDGGKDQEDEKFTVFVVPTVDDAELKGPGIEGKVKVTIKGKDFDGDTKVELKRDQDIIPAEEEGKKITETEIECIFDLTDKTAGTWAVVVTNLGAPPVEKANAFTTVTVPDVVKDAKTTKAEAAEQLKDLKPTWIPSDAADDRFVVAQDLAKDTPAPKGWEIKITLEQPET